MTEHSGTLEKWTNYWLGWQPRYFTLQNGTLSYFQNEDEVNMGAKASIRVASCEVTPDTIDNKRFDVCVGSGQKFSLRAPSTAERQTWLIALGTCKQAENEQRNSIRTKKRVGKMDKLQRKSTELRLYCDLLVQQVTSIQNAANGEDEEGRSLGENSQMVTATCKTFLKTLKEAMNLFEERVKDENAVPGLFSPTMSPNRSRSGSSNGSKLKRTPSTTSLPIGLCAPDSPTVSRVKGHNRQASTGSLEFSERNHVTYPDSRSLHSFHGAINESDAEPNSSHNSSKGQDQNQDDGILVVRSDPIDPDFSEPRQNSSEDENFDEPSEVLPKSLEKNPEESQSTENLESLSDLKSPMFFSQLEHSFVGVKFQTVEGQLEIPTESFLLASGDFLPILDKLGMILNRTLLLKNFETLKNKIFGCRLLGFS